MLKAQVKEEFFMKIVVATDGSEFSEKAIRKCCEIAGMADDLSVKIVSVYEPQMPAGAEPFALSGEYYEQLDQIARERAEQAADSAAKMLTKDCPHTPKEISSVVELGRPAQVIIDTAETWNADLIVVGSHGRGFWGRLTLGSVSDAVLHHAKSSVLVVK